MPNRPGLKIAVIKPRYQCQYSNYQSIRNRPTCLWLLVCNLCVLDANKFVVLHTGAHVRQYWRHDIFTCTQKLTGEPA